jgi:hypothetical protein
MTRGKKSGGRCSALLARRSLHPSDHLLCAFQPPPGVSVVSAVEIGTSIESPVPSFCLQWSDRPSGTKFQLNT